MPPVESAVMTCHGNSLGSPCCELGDAGTCPHLLPGPHLDGRRGACGLFMELGSWDEVHADERYLSDVRPHWIRYGVPDCGDWVGPGCCYGPGRTAESDAAYERARLRVASRRG